MISEYPKLPESQGKDIYHTASRVCDVLLSGTLYKAIRQIISALVATFRNDQVLVSGCSAGGMLALHDFLTRHDFTPLHILLEYPLLGAYIRSPKNVEYLNSNVSEATLLEGATQALIDFLSVTD